MVSIQKSSSYVPRLRDVKRKGNEKSPSTIETIAPSIVAKAVAQGLRSFETAQQAYQQIQYDLPSGKNHHALASYLAIKNQAKRDEFIALFGIDILV